MQFPHRRVHENDVRGWPGLDGPWSHGMARPLKQFSSTATINRVVGRAGAKNNPGLVQAGAQFGNQRGGNLRHGSRQEQLILLRSVGADDVRWLQAQREKPGAPAG